MHAPPRTKKRTTEEDELQDDDEGKQEEKEKENEKEVDLDGIELAVALVSAEVDHPERPLRDRLHLSPPF